MTLVGRIAKATNFPNRVNIAGPNWGALSGALRVNNASVGAMQQYSQVGALYGVVNRIAEAVSLVDWNLYSQSLDGKRTLVDDATAPAKHEATALWTHPNPWSTRQDFMHASDQYLSLAGEVYWLITQAGDNEEGFAQQGVQSDLELWVIHPARIRPIPDPDKYIIGYAYRNGSEEVPLNPQSVVTIRVPDPNNPLRGFGPVQSQLTDLDAERLAAQYNRNVLNNDATPGGIITYPDPMSDTDWDKLVTRWREQHQGVSNAARVAMLERGGTWQDVNLTHRDMQFKDLRQTNRDNIFLPFGMHAAIMGIAANVNRANAETARADFALWLLKPRLERYKSALNERVIPFTGENLAMDYVDPTPDDRAQIVNEAMSLWGWGTQTLNDTLSTLGKPTVDGPLGDQYLYQIIGTPAKMSDIPPAVVSQLAVSPPTMKAAWPPAMQHHEAEMETAWGKRLDTIGTELLDYIGANGKHS